MKKLLITFLSLAAILCLVLTACSKEKQGGKDDTAANDDENALVFQNEVKYAIVRADKCSKELSSAVAKFRTHLEDTFGYKFDINTDWSKDGKYDSSTFEILIGDTKYTETAQVKEALGDNDFAIVKKGNKIVITGIDDNATQDALNYFVNDMISFDGEKGVLMYAGNDFYYNKAEALSNFKINGVPLTDYSILCEKDNVESLSYARQVRDCFNSLFSYAPETKDVSKAGENNIIFSFSNHPSYTAADYMHYDIHVKGSDLIVSTGGYYSLERLLMNFTDTLFQNGIFDIDEDFRVSGNYFDAEEYKIDKNTDIRIVSANILAEYETWGSTIDVKYRTEIFAGNMNFYGADIIGVQEVSPHWLNFFKSEYNSPYKLLGKPSENTFTYILYNEETLEPIEFGYKDYSVKNNARARGIAYGVFKDKESGKIFAFGSTHWNGGDNDDCRKQLNEAAKVLNDLKAKYNCTIYCTGDFNSNEVTGVYKTFMELTDMEDTMYTTENRTNNYPSWHELGKEEFSYYSCDHIFASKGVRCVKYRTLVENSHIYASDHSWLCADIVLP